jgi:DNA mismatch repair ATPase MutS
LLNAWYGRRIHATYSRVFSRQPFFQQHAELFGRLADTPFASVRLRELQAHLSRSGLTAAREMAVLDRLKRLSDLRFQALFHFPINAITLWDFYVVHSLERWQRRVGTHLREWFRVLGEADVLAALGSVAHDNPEWAFAEIRPDADRLVATDLGHPVLPDLRRVTNDVEIGPPGTLLLVTGSNMSGKSTLLRSIGVNIVLAQAGAPVCASSLTMPPLQVATSMRVQDSLEAGVSYFMAALQRLKLVVEAARSSPPGPPGLIYLLDEVLQGTNTAERQVAVRHILQHLLSLPVLGAVTTHDLELAASPELRDTCRAVHFTEGVEGAGDEVRLSFDYRLRPGVATSRNALKLLHLVGLD